LGQVLEPLIEWPLPQQLAAQWTLGEADARRRVDELMGKAGLTMEHVMAEAVVLRLDEVERLDRLIAAAESRRTALLREVERHRAVLAQDLRRAADEIEEAQFEIVTPPAGLTGSA